MAGVEQTDTCWIWRNYRNPKGYGLFSVDGEATLVHRWAYQHFVGPIPSHLQIDHLCRVTSCANPRHLELVTAADNTRRRYDATRRTHCKSGHQYTPGDGCPKCRDKRRRLKRIGAAP